MPVRRARHCPPHSFINTDTRPAQGFSLTELMIVIAIISVLAGIAIPSYQSVTSSNRIAYEVNDLRGYIEIARSEALKQGLSVVICPSNNGTACSNGGWAAGWLIYTTAGGCTAGIQTIVKIRGALSGGDTLNFHPAPGNTNTHLCFTRMGLLATNYSGWLSFNAANAATSLTRCIALTAAGRPQVVRHGQPVFGAVNCA